MATAPNLVVAGDPGVARKLRETGRFSEVFQVASATELRDLSKSGQVGQPAAFLFTPGFTEDIPGAGVTVLANGLARGGFTVLVHSHFSKRGDTFDPQVRVTGERLKLSDLLGGGSSTTSPAAGSNTAPVPAEPPADAPASKAWPTPVPDPQTQQATAPNQNGSPIPSSNAHADQHVSNLPEPAAQPSQAPGSNGWPGPQPARANPWAAAGALAVKRGQVIAVASAKGGVGKTSTTVSLASYAARALQAAGRAGSVALVDTNFQQADVARYLNLESPTILDLVRNPGALSAGTVRGSLAHVDELDLYALLGPPDAINADPALINSSLYRRILAVLRQAFDYVFVDTPVAELYHTTFTDLILPEADAILVPVEPNRVTLEAAGTWLKAITMPQHSRGGGVDPEKISLILNRARKDVNCSPEDVMDLLPGWRFIGMIPEDHEWMQAVNSRRSPAARSSPALEATVRSILRTVTGDPVFETAAIAPAVRAARWKRLLGLTPQ